MIACQDIEYLFLQELAEKLLILWYIRLSGLRVNCKNIFGCTGLRFFNVHLTNLILYFT